MTDLATLPRLALAFPEAVDTSDDRGPNFSVSGKGFVWTYLARETPKGRRLPQPGVVAIRCPLETKEMLIDAAPDRFFTDDHYRGYPAVLARLAIVEEAELADLLAEAWRMTAPKRLVKQRDAGD